MIIHSRSPSGQGPLSNEDTQPRQQLPGAPREWGGYHPQPHHKPGCHFPSHGRKLVSSHVRAVPPCVRLGSGQMQQALVPVRASTVK